MEPHRVLQKKADCWTKRWRRLRRPLLSQPISYSGSTMNCPLHSACMHKGSTECTWSWKGVVSKSMVFIIHLTDGVLQTFHAPPATLKQICICKDTLRNSLKIGNISLPKKMFFILTTGVFLNEKGGKGTWRDCDICTGRIQQRPSNSFQERSYSKLPIASLTSWIK